MSCMCLMSDCLRANMIVTAETAAVSLQRRICRPSALQCWRASCRPAPLLLLAAARLRKLMTALLIKVTDGGWAAGRSVPGQLQWLHESAQVVFLNMYYCHKYLMTTLIFSFCNMIIDYEVSIYKLLFCIPTQDSKIFMDTIAMASSVKPLLETQLRISKNLLIHLLMSVSSSVATLKWIV